MQGIIKISTTFIQFKDALLKKISRPIERTRGPNIGMFVLILMHSERLFQICTRKVTFLIFSDFFSKINKNIGVNLRGIRLKGVNMTILSDVWIYVHPVVLHTKIRFHY